LSRCGSHLQGRLFEVALYVLCIASSAMRPSLRGHIRVARWAEQEAGSDEDAGIGPEDLSVVGCK
jgi:hypothetical protein